MFGKLKELGTITVTYFRVRRNVKPHTAPNQRPAKRKRQDVLPTDVGGTAPILSSDKVPEKNLKGRAITHQAR